MKATHLLWLIRKMAVKAMCVTVCVRLCSFTVTIWYIYVC